MVPPSLDGGAHVTKVASFSATATTPVGVPGTASGVTLDAAEATPVPRAFVAVTHRA